MIDTRKWPVSKKLRGYNEYDGPYTLTIGARFVRYGDKFTGIVWVWHGNIRPDRNGNRWGIVRTCKPVGAYNQLLEDVSHGHWNLNN